MRRLIYTSMARQGLAFEDCAAILKGAAANNARCGISGVLLLKDSTFLQYLEGPSAALETTLAVIRRDPRHSHFTVLVDEPQAASTRLFRHWLMGFHHLSAAEPVLADGILRNDDAQPMEALQYAAADDLCGRLLHAFWRANRRGLAARHPRSQAQRDWV